MISSALFANLILVSEMKFPRGSWLGCTQGSPTPRSLAGVAPSGRGQCRARPPAALHFDSPSPESRFRRGAVSCSLPWAKKPFLRTKIKKWNQVSVVWTFKRQENSRKCEVDDLQIILETRAKKLYLSEKDEQWQRTGGERCMDHRRPFRLKNRTLSKSKRQYSGFIGHH